LTPSGFSSLREVRATILLEEDKRNWRRTAAMMGLTATIGTSKSYSADDFDPYHKEDDVEKSSVTLLSLIGEINEGLGGVDLRNRRKIDA
jgi:hypothetical protein